MSIGHKSSNVHRRLCLRFGSRQVQEVFAPDTIWPRNAKASHVDSGQTVPERESAYSRLFSKRKSRASVHTVVTLRRDRDGHRPRRHSRL